MVSTSTPGLLVPSSGSAGEERDSVFLEPDADRWGCSFIMLWSFFSQFLSRIRYPAFKCSIHHVSTFMWKFYLWKSCSFTPMMPFYTWSMKTAVHESWWKSITAVAMSSVVEGPALKCHWMRWSRVETLRSQVRRLTKPWSHLLARSPRPALQVHTASLLWGSFEGFFPAFHDGCFPSSALNKFFSFNPNPYILNYAAALCHLSYRTLETMWI